MDHILIICVGRAPCRKGHCLVLSKVCYGKFALKISAASMTSSMGDTEPRAVTNVMSSATMYVHVSKSVSIKYMFAFPCLRSKVCILPADGSPSVRSPTDLSQMDVCIPKSIQTIYLFTSQSLCQASGVSLTCAAFTAQLGGPGILRSICSCQ